MTFTTMRGAAAILCLCALPTVASAQAGSQVIRASRILDGTGRVLTNSDIVVTDGRITAIRPATGALPANGIDLRQRTVLPGLIDTHVHIGWYVNSANRLHTDSDGDSPATQAFSQAGNAWVTLRAGFTTVQSIGEPENATLRDAIDRGTIPGPRVLTSLGSMNERTGGGSPDSLRAAVRRFKAMGADVIKIFASKSIREGGDATMSDEQLAAACGESTAQGLRSIVHAHSAEAVERTARNGCTQIEHGVFVTDASRALMVKHGVFFDPQCGLVFHNYLDNKPRFDGIGNYNAVGFAAMERAIPLAEGGIRAASRTPSLKLVFGTDAVAGAHGRNAEELVCRVRRGGQPAMDAIVSATSRAAESLRLDKEIGRIAIGYAADIIATDGDPITEIEATQRVVFVMRSGTVYRNGRSAPPDPNPGARAMKDRSPNEQRRSFLKIAGALAATAAAGCRLESRAPETLATAANDRPEGFDRSVLDPLAEVVLPSELGEKGRDGAIGQFVAWADDYDPVAEEMHGYGYSDIRYLPPDPAPAWRAQLAALELLARKSRQQSFARLAPDARRELLGLALNGDAGAHLPSPLHAKHIAIALLAHWASSPDAWDLALGAKVRPGTCRVLGDASAKPLPITGLRA